jgi:hypothetical protein
VRSASTSRDPRALLHSKRPAFSQWIGHCTYVSRSVKFISTLGAVILILVILAAAVLVYYAWRTERSKKLRSRFGPEYDHAVREYGTRGQAEISLEARQQRVERIHIRSLSELERDHSPSDGAGCNPDLWTTPYSRSSSRRIGVRDDETARIPDGGLRSPCGRCFRGSPAGSKKLPLSARHRDPRE